ncbi:MAG: FoF1 ATP synthase subunit a [Dehalococcoidales bacterium]|nr:FoF1 ATP synthase subunit a [Dehalococcoidales bacterium]
MAKKRLMGCSLPVAIILGITLLLLSIASLATGPLGGNALKLPKLFIVEKPEVELPATIVFHLFGFPITNSIVATWVTIVVLGVFCWAVTRKMQLVPGRKQALLEFAIEALLNFCRSIAGEKNGRRFFPIVATIFLFVAFNAWLSLLPGYGSILVHFSDGGETHLLRGANTDVNTPLALAIVSFVFVEIIGFRSLGISYGKKFLNLGGIIESGKYLVKGKIKSALSSLIFGILNLFVGFIEFISELIRVVSLTVRLFGNMTAGEILLLIAVFLMPWLFALPFYGLELLVGFVQALIFASLTLIFLTTAVASHGGHKEESAHH